MLFKAINIWERASENKVILYRCFELIGDTKFCVQSADYYSLPIDEKAVRDHELKFIELFAEESPNVRSQLYSSIPEAIEAFKKDFEI
jgi:hypothetical protein